MEIYVHEGSGHYIGSVVVVQAKSRADAEIMILDYLRNNGLGNEPLDIQAVVKKPGIIYAQNGDY